MQTNHVSFLYEYKAASQSVRAIGDGFVAAIDHESERENSPRLPLETTGGSEFEETSNLTLDLLDRLLAVLTSYNRTRAVDCCSFSLWDVRSRLVGSRERNFESESEDLFESLLVMAVRRNRSSFQRSFAAVSESGLSLLHIAALLGYCYLALALVEVGADVNALDSFGRTPLHLAVAAGDVACVNALLHAGADELAVDGNNLTAQQAAVSSGYIEMLALFKNVSSAELPLKLRPSNKESYPSQLSHLSGHDVASDEEDVEAMEAMDASILTSRAFSTLTLKGSLAGFLNKSFRG